MSYYVDGEPIFNYDEIWPVLKAAGDLELPALVSFAFGGQPANADLLSDLNRLRNAMDSTHDLISVVDRAIGALHQLAQT